MANPVLSCAQSNEVCYESTATTFRKSSRLPFDDFQLDITPFVWFRPWNHERITNEAKALELVARETTIPVPRLIEHGIHPDGRRYLVTELVDGVVLDRVGKAGCLRPQGRQHKEAKPCTTCCEEAYSKAVAFVENVVLPQLSSLNSKERGIDGFVMPPNWLSPDMQVPWKGKKAFRTLPLPTASYIFQHGNLSAHSIMIDKTTLQVKAILDWEYAGFYPPGWERWLGALDGASYARRVDNVASAIAEFLPEEYLECCEKWPNQQEIRDLVNKKELPDPVRLKLELGCFAPQLHIYNGVTTPSMHHWVAEEHMPKSKGEMLPRNLLSVIGISTAFIGPMSEHLGMCRARELPGPLAGNYYVAVERALGAAAEGERAQLY
ncbi:hypothetical protein PWT90_10158 [Aphanocladium album]|nr:hypothetical protein PWT90_10158 [Aphanocladium album]